MLRLTDLPPYGETLHGLLQLGVPVILARVNRVEYEPCGRGSAEHLLFG